MKSLLELICCLLLYQRGATLKLDPFYYSYLNVSLFELVIHMEMTHSDLDKYSDELEYYIEEELVCTIDLLTCRGADQRDNVLVDTDLRLCYCDYESEHQDEKLRKKTLEIKMLGRPWNSWKISSVKLPLRNTDKDPFKMNFGHTPNHCDKKEDIVEKTTRYLQLEDGKWEVMYCPWGERFYLYICGCKWVHNEEWIWDDNDWLILKITLLSVSVLSILLVSCWYFCCKTKKPKKQKGSRSSKKTDGSTKRWDVRSMTSWQRWPNTTAPTGSQAPSNLVLSNNTPGTEARTEASTAEKSKLDSGGETRNQKNVLQNIFKRKLRFLNKNKPEKPESSKHDDTGPAMDARSSSTDRSVEKRSEEDYGDFISVADSRDVF